MPLSQEEQQLLDLLLKKKNPDAAAGSVRTQHFYNWSDEDITCTWNGVPYTVKAKDRVVMEDWRAKHTAKYLAQRELNRANEDLPAGARPHDLVFGTKREEYEQRALGPIVDEAGSEQELMMKTMNPAAEKGPDPLDGSPGAPKPHTVTPASEMKAPKGHKAKAAKGAAAAPEDHFEGLDEAPSA